MQTFTRYGWPPAKAKLLFFLVSPTNISVLSHANVEIKIRHLMMVLSALPNIEITCTDACECFDGNRAYLQDGSRRRPVPRYGASSRRIWRC